MKSRVVYVDRPAQFRRHFRVHPGIEHQDAGIDEVRLAFEQSRAHRRHKAVDAEQREARAGERDRLTIQVIHAAAFKHVVDQTAIGQRRVAKKSATGELLVRRDAVESPRPAVVQVAVARGEEERSAVCPPVLLVSDFERGQLRVDVLRILIGRDRIELVASKRLVERMRHIDAADVPVPGNARVGSANLVRHRQSDGRGTNQEAIFVDEERRLIVAVEQAEIQVVAGRREIRPVEIGRIHRLVAPPPAVETAVGVLLDQIKVSQVVLEHIVMECAEQTHARLLIRVDESAEIAGEPLNSGAQRGEIEIGAAVIACAAAQAQRRRRIGEQPFFDEHLLESDVGVRSAQSAPARRRGSDRFRGLSDS